jgi:hypothetical protein
MYSTEQREHASRARAALSVSSSLTPVLTPFPRTPIPPYAQKPSATAPRSVGQPRRPRGRLSGRDDASEVVAEREVLRRAPRRVACREVAALRHEEAARLVVPRARRKVERCHPEVVLGVHVRLPKPPRRSGVSD